jgi:PAS domain S-box-containing protein
MADNNPVNYDMIDLTPIPFAHKQAVRNKQGEVVDFVFIHVNPALEKMTGFSKESLLGRSEFELYGFDKTEIAKQLQYFSKRIFQGEEVEITQYSKALKKWYRIKVIADGNDKIFVWFFDIMPEMVLLEHSKDIFNAVEISPHTLAERAFQISGSAFVFFCELDKNLQKVQFADTYYTDENFSGLSDHLLSDYEHIPIITEYDEYKGLQDQDFSRLTPELRHILQDFASYTIKVQPIKIAHKLLGVFVFFFKPANAVNNENLLITFAEQTGLLLHSKRVEKYQARIEETLQSERTQRNLITQHITDGFAVFENDRITYLSPSYEKLTGYTAAETIGMRFEEIFYRIHPEDRERILNLIQTTHHERKERVSYRYRLLKKDGRYLWVEDTIRIIYEGTGRTKTYISARDISGQVFYEKELIQSEERFKTLLENVQDSVFVHEIDEKGMPGRFIFVNHVAHERLGYTAEEFQNILVKDIDTSEKAANIPQIMETLFREGFVRFQGEHVAKDGRIIPVDISSSLITLEGKKVVISVSRDLSERLKNLQREKKDKELLQSILNTLPGKLVVVDKERRIVAANKKALYRIKTHEKTVSQLIGKKCHWVFQKNPVPCEICKLDKMCLSKERFSEITTEREKSGEVKYSQFFYAPVFKTDGNISGLVEYKEDVTDLILAQKKAEEANRVKTEFMMNMSHELRTPLNGILGFSNIIESTCLSEEQMQYIKNIKTSGQHLLSIVNDILDFSKLQTNQLQLKSEPINLKRLLKLSLSLIKKPAIEKGLKTFLKIDSNLPEIILSDQLRLSQVIGNLLYNALKFTHRGSVTLSAASLRQVSDGIILQIAVQDTGIGIDVNKRNDIFESFTQADSSLTRQFGGTGLGLTISNNILKLMNSHLELESRLGVGSRFSFNLYVKTPKEHAVAKQNRTKELLVQNSESFTLLAVDDDPVNLKINTLIVEKYFPNAKILTASDGREAVKAYLLERPDIVLMDIRMPGKNGITTTEEIRRAQNSPVIIIGVSADVQEKTINDAYKNGLDDYLIKPFTPEQLIGLLKKHLICES